jgi:hypothetical protein
MHHHHRRRRRHHHHHLYHATSHHCNQIEVKSHNPLLQAQALPALPPLPPLSVWWMELSEADGGGWAPASAWAPVLNNRRRGGSGDGDGGDGLRGSGSGVLEGPRPEEAPEPGPTATPTVATSLVASVGSLLTEGQRQVVRRAFEMCDKDGSGSLTASDLAEITAKGGAGAPDDGIHNIHLAKESIHIHTTMIIMTIARNPRATSLNNIHFIKLSTPTPPPPMKLVSKLLPPPQPMQMRRWQL